MLFRKKSHDFIVARNKIDKAIKKVFEIILGHLEEIFQNFYNRCSTEDIPLEENKFFHDGLSNLHKLAKISSLKEFRKKYTKLLSWVEKKIEALSPIVKAREQKLIEFKERRREINEISCWGDPNISTTMTILLGTIDDALNDFPNNIDSIKELLKSVEFVTKAINKKFNL